MQHHMRGHAYILRGVCDAFVLADPSHGDGFKLPRMKLGRSELGDGFRAWNIPSDPAVKDAPEGHPRTRIVVAKEPQRRYVVTASARCSGAWMTFMRLSY